MTVFYNMIYYYDYEYNWIRFSPQRMLTFLRRKNTQSENVLQMQRLVFKCRTAKLHPGTAPPLETLEASVQSTTNENKMPVN